MKQYIKPSISILSCESLGAKLQGTGVALICSGSECDSAFGASCALTMDPNENYVSIGLFERGVECPAAGSPSCEVTALSVNDIPIENPSSLCHVGKNSGSDCSAGCSFEIRCTSAAAQICDSVDDIIHATVSCSGFEEPVACDKRSLI